MQQHYESEDEKFQLLSPVFLDQVKEFSFEIYAWNISLF